MSHHNHNNSQWRWLTQHADTVIILSALAGGFLWMNAKFNAIEFDVNTIKTVLIVKKIMPCELANKDDRASH